MAKRKRNKFDNEGSQPPKAHITHRRNLRPHIAQEARELGDIPSAESLTRGLMPKFRGRVQGLKDTHYRYPGFRSTGRRDVLSTAQKEKSGQST